MQVCCRTEGHTRTHNAALVLFNAFLQSSLRLFSYCSSNTLLFICGTKIRAQPHMCISTRADAQVLFSVKLRCGFCAFSRHLSAEVAKSGKQRAALMLNAKLCENQSVKCLTLMAACEKSTSCSRSKQKAAKRRNVEQRTCIRMSRSDAQ